MIQVVKVLDRCGGGHIHTNTHTIEKEVNDYF